MGTSVLADPRPRTRTINTTSFRIALLIVIMQMLDLFATLWHASTGFPEANPLARAMWSFHGPLGVVIFKIYACSIFLFTTHKLIQSDRPRHVYFLVVMLLFGVVLTLMMIWTWAEFLSLGPLDTYQPQQMEHEIRIP